MKWKPKDNDIDKEEVTEDDHGPGLLESGINTALYRTNEEQQCIRKRWHTSRIPHNTGRLEMQWIGKTVKEFISQKNGHRTF